MAGLGQAASPAIALEPAASLKRASRVASEDPSARLPRPIVWLGFAGWALSCGMLFVSLLQREPMGGRENFAQAIVSAALETARDTFGDVQEISDASRNRANPTVERR